MFNLKPNAFFKAAYCRFLNLFRHTHFPIHQNYLKSSIWYEGIIHRFSKTKFYLAGFG